MSELTKVLVTASPTAPLDQTILETPGTRPNVEVVVMQWWKQTLIRTTRTYLQSLVGFILAAGTGAAQAVGINLPAGDFLTLLYGAASLAIAPAAISLLQNAIEILSSLDTPRMRA